MRGSVAEQRGGSGSSRGDGAGSAARGSGGYSLKSNGQGERLGGHGVRGTGTRWEIRLGTLQVTVWLGLALGACVGGYFVGFFSGRYVGFESARESSASAVIKLPAQEMVADAGLLNPKPVYDKLKAPAILPDSGGPRASAKVTEGDVPTESRAVRSGRGDSPKGEAFQDASVSRSTGTAAPDSGDDIFNDSGGEVIIGDDGSLDEEIEERSPSSVRMLGGGAAGAAAAAIKTGEKSAEKPAGSSSSAAAILDARIANARSEAGRVAQEEFAASQEAKRPPNELVNTRANESSGLVRKVLPPGYFAQVSAPKKLSEAEAVAKKLKRSGFPVVVEAASVNGQSFYRVLVGPEENKLQADRLVGQLQSESYVASKPFIRKVK